jgi:hypothetical protein
MTYRRALVAALAALTITATLTACESRAQRCDRLTAELAASRDEERRASQVIDDVTHPSDAMVERAATARARSAEIQAAGVDCGRNGLR